MLERVILFIGGCSEVSPRQAKTIVRVRLGKAQSRRPIYQWMFEGIAPPSPDHSED